jgi:hypothetical protein
VDVVFFGWTGEAEARLPLGNSVHLFLSQVVWVPWSPAACLSDAVGDRRLHRRRDRVRRRVSDSTPCTATGRANKTSGSYITLSRRAPLQVGEELELNAHWQARALRVRLARMGSRELNAACPSHCIMQVATPNPTTLVGTAAHLRAEQAATLRADSDERCGPAVSGW